VEHGEARQSAAVDGRSRIWRRGGERELEKVGKVGD
jgi:hypothetical protein